MDYVTTEINNLFASLDHNSLLYNLQFLNVFVPLIAQTMVARVTSEADLAQTEMNAKRMLNFAQDIMIEDFGNDCRGVEPLNDQTSVSDKDYRVEPGFFVTNVPRWISIRVSSCDEKQHTKMGRTFYPEPFAFYNFSSTSIMRFSGRNNWQETLANFEQSIKSADGNYQDKPV